MSLLVSLLESSGAVTPPNGTAEQLLANNGAGGFANVTVAGGLSYNSTTKVLTGAAGNVEFVGHYDTPEELPGFPSQGAIAIVGELNIIYIFDYALYFAWVSTGVAGGTVFSNANQVFTKSQAGAITRLLEAPGSIGLDLSLPNFKIVLEEPTNTLNASNIVPGTVFVFDVWQDATGGRTLDYAWYFEFPNGVAPTLSTEPFARDQLYLYTSYYGTSTVTISVADPCVITWEAHGLISGQKLQLYADDTLPAGLTPETTYWVNVIDADTFNVAASLADLRASIFIETTDAGVGPFTAFATTIDISSNPNIL